jgi:predicted RNA-binding protein associated with RNAse of E/G family
VLVLRRRDEAYSVWHFWDGPGRSFAGWYLNLEEPFRRTSVGYDTQDLELDVWIPVGEPWRFKDEEQLAERVREGRYTEEQAAAARALGDELGAMLDRGERWWDERWASFVPDPAWRAPVFPSGWTEAPVPAAPPASAYRWRP